MKILSWNVNGIRAISKKGFLEWLQQESPDILCIQETKASPDQLSNELLNPLGYKTYWSSAEKKGYSGVSVFTKKTPVNVSEYLDVKKFDTEGRTLILDYGKFVLFNIYFPNGGREKKRVPFKMKFYDAFLKKCESFRKEGRKVIVCGDVNTAHTEIDLARPVANKNNTGFLPEERAWMTKFINKGYIDTFRVFESQDGHYSWWDYKTGARKRDVGWRIDYFFITENLRNSLKNAFILKNVFGSDHCPVGIRL
ncbi:MAG: exodeoxyribonuclease III [Candidatus Zapsychrus exili]|nr:exodeoxyribonuclease III [Candidatus Zapsychrus exili]